MRFRGSLALATGSAVLVIGAPIASANPSLSDYDRSVKAGKTAQVTVGVPKASSCRVTVAGKREIVSINGAGWARFSMKTRAKARSGKYPVTVTCDGKSTRYRLTVKGKKRGSKKVIERISSTSGLTPVSPTPPTTSAPAPPANSPPPPPRDYDGETEAYYQSYRNKFYGTGECVDWAMQKREDLFRAMTWPLINAWFRNGGPRPELAGDARTWTDFARRAGLRVDKTPRVGALMVWQPGTYNTPETGHIAYIELVNPNGSFFYSHMNANGQRGTVNRAYAPADYVVDGIDMIG